MNLLAIVGAAGFALGSLVGYSIERAQVLHMEKVIAVQKLEASEQLAKITNRVNTEILENIELNKEVDLQGAAHEQELSTINTTLRNLRLRKPKCRADSSSSGTKDSSTGDIKSEASSDGVPEGLHEFLTERTLYADRNTGYALACYDFVINRNCGLRAE